MKAYWATINERHDINKFDFIYLNNEQTFTLSTLISTATDVKMSNHKQKQSKHWVWLSLAPSGDIDELLDPELDVGEVLVWERRQQRLHRRLVLALATIIIIISLSLSLSLSRDDHLQYPLCQQPPHHLPPGAQRPEPLVLGLGRVAAGHCNPSSSGWDGGG